MKEYSILMNGPMVRAILDGSKTQTRRILSPQPEYVWGWGVPNSDPEHFCAHVRYPGRHQPDPWVRCPYGVPPNRGKLGSRLWVRETWREGPSGALYRATDDDGTPAVRWKPSIHMPRRYSRITLEIVSIRVERVKQISDADILSEGFPEDPPSYAEGFAGVWDRINGKRGFGWDVNPFVWVIEFKRIAP